MGLFRRKGAGARRTDHLPLPVDPDTLAGAYQLGLDGGSGMVPRHRAWTEPDMGGRVELHPHVVQSVPVLDSTRIPESWYQDRPLFGGYRAAPHFREFLDEPGMTGGYTIMAGRVPFIIGEPELMPAESNGGTSFREPPTPEVCRSVPVIG